MPQTRRAPYLDVSMATTNNPMKPSAKLNIIWWCSNTTSALLGAATDTSISPLLGAAAAAKEVAAVLAAEVEADTAEEAAEVLGLSAFCRCLAFEAASTTGDTTARESPEPTAATVLDVVLQAGGIDGLYRQHSPNTIT